MRLPAGKSRNSPSFFCRFAIKPDCGLIMRVIVLCALIFTFSHLTLAAPVIFGPRTRVETSVEARGFMTSIKGFLGTTKTKAQNYLPKMFSTVNVVDNRFRKLAKSRDGMKLSPAVKENVKAKLVNLRRGLKKFQGSENRQQVATLVDEVLSAIHLLRHGQGNQVTAFRELHEGMEQLRIAAKE
ncbi:hypothetical protein C8J56DRAFT_268573 [Mycena floridula]|nr:hypothetical protein C8J56DRAFT_268573 [Mycena floridula]